MKEEKRHVGRPTNEEVKERKNKKIIQISIIASILVILTLVLCIKTNFIKINGNANDAKELKIYGAYEVKAYNKINFKTNVAGAKITVSSHGLSPRYKNSIVTKTADEFMYVEYYVTGKKYVTVSKKGYKTVRRQFVVIPFDIKLTCPKTVKVGEEFTCETNVHNAYISVSKKGLASGYNTTFKTTLSDKTKQSKYTTPGVKKVTVVRKGYRKLTRNVTVIK